MADPARPMLRALSGLDPESALSTFFNYSPTGIYIATTEGEIAAVNDAFCRLVGYGREELIGRHAETLIHRDDAGVRERLSVISKLRPAYSLESRYIRKNGTAIRLRATAATERDPATGEPRWVIVQLADMTAPDTEEPRELHPSSDSALHEKLNIALAAGRIGVWELDIAREAYHWDSGMHELYGLAPGTYDGTTEMWESFVVPADRARRNEEWAEAHARAGDAASEYRIVRADGTLRYIRSSYRVFRDEQGQPFRAIGANFDITEHKLAAARAIEEKERLSITLRSIGDAVICTDAQSNITFMNPIAEKLTGWSSQEAHGLRLLDVFNIFSERSGDSIADPVRECIAQGSPFKMDSGAVLVTRSGGALDIGLSAAPVSANGVDFIGAIIVFNDITEIRAKDKRMAHSALHDSLTGLPNRAAFMAKMNEAIQQARDEDCQHVLSFIDLDRFKHVNDTGGHAAGDAVLREIAKVIALSCNRSDVPARLGGDEFAVLFRDCRPESADNRLRSIIAAVAEKDFWWDNTAYRVGASIGATLITRQSPELGDILREADKACYAAKQAGRGCLTFHSDLSRNEPHPVLPPSQPIFPGSAKLH